MFSLRVVSSLFALSLLAVTGCSAARDGDHGSEDELRLKPQATEKMARVTVQLPSNVCAPGESCSHPVITWPYITIDNGEVAIGSQQRLAPGTHTLAVDLNSQFSFTVAAGEQRVITLPIARRVCAVDASNVPSSDFGRRPSLRHSMCPAPDANGTVTRRPFQAWFYSGRGCSIADVGYTDSLATCDNIPGEVDAVWVNGICRDLPHRSGRETCRSFVVNDPLFTDADAVIAPGTYEFALESREGVRIETRNVGEGEIAELELKLPQLASVPGTFKTEIENADARELPDAMATTISSGCENPYTVAHDATGTLSLTAYQFPECAYSLFAGGRSVALVQNTTNKISLHRLDIDNVTVTREDGSTFDTAGTYEVFFGGARVAGPYATGTGIDALPGDYEVVVTYSTAEGQKINRYPVSF